MLLGEDNNPRGRTMMREHWPCCSEADPECLRNDGWSLFRRLLSRCRRGPNGRLPNMGSGSGCVISEAAILSCLRSIEEDALAWTEITRPQYRRDHLRYASDATDEEWRV